VENETRAAKIPFKQLDKVTVCQGKEMALSPGDRLQLKANGRSVENKKLANGELVTVKAVHAGGRIALADGRTLDKDFRQFVRGYAVTSYAAQGKSVDYVLFSDSAVKAATNNQQWYVTISRGKKGIHIFTGDKEQLRDNITRSGDRPLALDMAKPETGFARQLSKSQRRDAARLLAAEHSQRAAAKRGAERFGQSTACPPSAPHLAQPGTTNQGIEI